MKLAVLAAPERFEIVDEPMPTAGRDEVLLRVGACGVCASELDMYRGLAGHASYPWEPGHEVSGVVEATGDLVENLAVGDAVAAWVTSRGFAEYVTVKADHCFPAGPIPLDQALGEPIACALNAVELGEVAFGDDVVVIGAGFMGQLIHRLVQLRGPRRVVVFDTRDEALALAATSGATEVINPTRESPAEAVRKATGEAGADVAFEITGLQVGLDLLGEVTRMSGTVVIAGYHQGPPRSLPLADWNWMAYRIANAHFREPSVILRGMRRGMRLLTSGRISMEGLVTHLFPLNEIGAAFEAAIAKPQGFVKATVIP